MPWTRPSLPASRESAESLGPEKVSALAELLLGRGLVAGSTGQHFDKYIRSLEDTMKMFRDLYQIEDLVVEGSKLFAVSLGASGATTRRHREKLRRF